MQKVSLQKRIEDGYSDDKKIWEASKIPVPGLRAYLPRADGFTEAVRGSYAQIPPKTGKERSEDPRPH